MSEYQYYEFQTIDRPLTKQQMAELRAVSKRAKITATSFVNVYNYGDLHAEPLDLMRRYFDAFVYVANWGTHRLMLRISQRLLDLKTAERYCWSDGAEVEEDGGQIILDFTSQEDGGGDWETGEEWLAQLLPLRDEIARGDRRPLYLAWLKCAQDGDIDDEAAEPPVPPGLGNLTAAQRAFADFLRIGDELLEVAAEASGAPPAAPDASAFRRWVLGLPGTEKDALLVRWADEDTGLRADTMRQFLVATAQSGPSGEGTTARTVAMLVETAEARVEQRERAEAERVEQQKHAEAERKAAERGKYLDTLLATEAAVWRTVELGMATTRPAAYDEAVRLLLDLRAMSERHGRNDEFVRRFGALRETYRRKPSLMLRLTQAGLSGG